MRGSSCGSVVPIATQIMLEVGVFATAAALAGRISATALAANQIVLNVAGFFFMIPYGLGSAAAVSVGHAAGRHDAHGVRRSGWVALSCALAVAVDRGDALSRDPARVPRDLHDGRDRARRRHEDSDRVRDLSAVRRLPGRGHGRAPRHRRHAHADDRELRRALADRSAAGLLALLLSRGWGVLGLWSGLGGSLILVGASVLVAWHWETR